MSRVCTICTSESTVRQEIDRALVGGEPVEQIARRYPPLSATSIRRHRAGHIGQTIAKAEAVKEAAHGDDLLDQVHRLKSKAVSLLLKAEAAGDFRTALSGIREARSCLEILLEVEGELNRATNVNVLIASPDWIATRGALLTALRPFPEARQAVVAELLKLEGGQ